MSITILALHDHKNKIIKVKLLLCHVATCRQVLHVRFKTVAMHVINVPLEWVAMGKCCKLYFIFWTISFFSKQKFVLCVFKFAHLLAHLTGYIQSGAWGGWSWETNEVLKQESTHDVTQCSLYKQSHKSRKRLLFPSKAVEEGWVTNDEWPITYIQDLK